MCMCMENVWKGVVALGDVYLGCVESMIVGMRDKEPRVYDAPTLVPMQIEYLVHGFEFKIRSYPRIHLR